MANLAVRAIATDDEGSGKLNLLALLVKDYPNAIILGNRRNECGFVLDGAASATQLLHQQAFRDVLRNHSDEPVGSLFGFEVHAGKRTAMCDYGNGRDTVGLLKEWTDYAGHVKDLKRPRENCQRFGMLRLRSARLDEPPSQTPASTFVRQK